MTNKETDKEKEREKEESGKGTKMIQSVIEED